MLTEGLLGALGLLLVALVAVLGHQGKRITDLEESWNTMRKAAELDAITKRAQGDFIDTLEAHIWHQCPPPPPSRPAGV